MKRVLLIVAVLFASLLSVSGQINMSVLSGLEADFNDLEARSYSSERDYNDKLCAIIKIKPDNPLVKRLYLHCRGGMVTVKSDETARDNGEWWFWVSPEVTNIRLTCEGYTDIDWMAVSLKPGVVYRLNLSVESSVIFIKEYTGSNMVPFRMAIEPKNARVSYGDSEDQIIESVDVTDGYFDTFLSPGSHYFSVESKFYETYTAEINVKKEMPEVEVSLTPAFNTLVVNTEPQYAEVYLDGDFIGQTPLFPSGKVSKGDHTLLFKKKNYYPEQKKVTANGDGSTKTLQKVSLKPQFGTVSLYCEDAEAKLTVTDPKGSVVFEGKSGDSIELNSTMDYKLEASKPHHHPQSVGIIGKTIEGKDRKVSVDSPFPIYGELQLSSTPTRAEVFVDDQRIGQTIIAKKLIVGSHKVELRKEGYQSLVFSVDILEGEETRVSKTLMPFQKSQEPVYRTFERVNQSSYPVRIVDTGVLNVICDPVGAEVYIDGKRAGITPFSKNSMSPGLYEVELIKIGYEPKTFKVQIDNGKTTAVTTSLEPIVAKKSIAESIGDYFESKPAGLLLYPLTVSLSVTGGLLFCDGFECCTLGQLGTLYWNDWGVYAHLQRIDGSNTGNLFGLSHRFFDDEKSGTLAWLLGLGMFRSCWVEPDLSFEFGVQSVSKGFTITFGFNFVPDDCCNWFLGLGIAL